jgi:hypothetical protein
MEQMDLPDPAARRDAHLVADWVELAAAADRDGLVAGDALVDAREEVENRRGRETSPAKTDAWQREAEEVWALLRARAGFYGAAYPFDVADDALELRTLELTDLRLVYGFLLASASLSAFAETDRHLLTGGFERASRHVLAALLPESATVGVFGTSSKGDEHYSQSKLIDRLEQLAEDLVTQLTLEAKAQAEKSPPRISGDGGLDLVGWPELSGPRKRVPIYFGQCACGRDWHRKPYEVIASTWDHRLEPVSPIVPVTLIPYAYRAEDNDWLDLFSVIPTVLIDRPRWLRLVETSARIDDAIEDVPRDWMLGELPGLAAG